VTGDDGDDRDGQESDATPPWHNSTPKLLGASLAGLAAIALIVAGVTALMRQADAPADAPVDFVDPTFASSQTSDSAASSTSTVTTTQSIQTTEINPGDPALTPSGSASSGSETPGSESTSPESRTPRTRRSDGPSTTRSRPRLNETRTLYPAPN
jgi:hypothetical protein